MGFKTYEFDKCTFNKLINGYLCTVQVHVDDLKLSHVQQYELNKIIDQLNEVFGSDGDLLITLMMEDSVTQPKKSIVTAAAALTHRLRFRKSLNSII